MKAVGVLIIALGLIMIVVGIQGSQSTILQTLKSVNPTLRKQTGTTGGTTANTTPAGNATSGGNTGTVALA
jgi:uncharacterized protein YoxC